ncbi:hypothetical protein GbCGDNIH2_7181 [Granulibacter bethesdensis]|uniref:Uncharacterized protein n=1 Tax=Granulibacter bethesdensis (strain ATCC BAA-1260 / CGDNIH1) TaxID=391165 RepID=A0A286M324_GRABC|nr:hypothetical protein GbCGDNIH2_7181 [Granulibacter bethesdensis]APH64825.1 hypothetical protein GbCGDNIH1I4_7181 [Granulibacter bethesdensis]ASV62423.1 hypothetical protein GbCGDNIH1_7181 [Granulibacter bethesdensis CGDNIH1]
MTSTGMAMAQPFRADLLAAWTVSLRFQSVKIVPLIKPAGKS